MRSLGVLQVQLRDVPPSACRTLYLKKWLALAADAGFAAYCVDFVTLIGSNKDLALGVVVCDGHQLVVWHDTFRAIICARRLEWHEWVHHSDTYQPSKCRA